MREPQATCQNTEDEFTDHTADPLIGVPISVPIFVLISRSDVFCCFYAEKLKKQFGNKNQNINQGGTFPQQIWTPINRVA